MYDFIEPTDTDFKVKRTVKNVDSNDKYVIDLVMTDYPRFLKHNFENFNDFTDESQPLGGDRRDKYFTMKKIKKFGILYLRKNYEREFDFDIKPLKDKIFDLKLVEGIRLKEKEREIFSMKKKRIPNDDIAWSPYIKGRGRPVVKKKFWNDNLCFNKGRPKRNVSEKRHFPLEYSSENTLLNDSLFMEARLVILKPVDHEKVESEINAFGYSYFMKLREINYLIRYAFTCNLENKLQDTLKSLSYYIIQPCEIGYSSKLKLDFDFEISKELFRPYGFYFPEEIEKRKAIAKQRRESMDLIEKKFAKRFEYYEDFMNEFEPTLDRQIKTMDQSLIYYIIRRLFETGKNFYSELSDLEQKEIVERQMIIDKMNGIDNFQDGNDNETLNFYQQRLKRRAERLRRRPRKFLFAGN